MRYRAAPPASLRVEPLDGGLLAVLHRASGITHIVTEPVPELLAALAEPATPGKLMDRLAADYDLADPEPAALVARVEELAAAGLVERLPGA